MNKIYKILIALCICVCCFFCFNMNSFAATAPYKVKTTASSLRVRTGNGTNYKRVGSLPRGTVVTVYDKSSNGWLKISYNGGYYWISGNYTTKINSTPQNTTPSTNQTSASGKLTITASSLNVRRGAGTSYSIITSVKRNNVYNYTSTAKVGNTTWYKIQVNNSTTGWVCGKYIKFTKATPTPSTPAPAPSVPTNTSKRFNLTASQRDYIERVVAAEARGERYGGKAVGSWGTTYNGMAAVAQVIYDRAVHGGYGSNPYNVASRKGQFASPYKGTVSVEVKAAVSAVFDYNYRVTDKPLYYFCMNNCYPSWAKQKTYVMTIGNHKFYR